MSGEPEAGLLAPQDSRTSRPLDPGARGHRRPGVDCLSVRRAWDLHPGDCLHGRVIASVHGVVGLACSPVAVFSFTGDDPEHIARTRIGAAHPDVELGCDDVWRAARAWVRGHGLHEGESVDLDLLRAEVLVAVAQA
ncbi:hypothetical protein ACH9DO_13850 [Kocuria sp. M1N1S27]|uniref:hypothetical protein n=1 Tax=Kocuria kalidii TaxID=3376283 RepID=UPI00378C8CAF